MMTFITMNDIAYLLVHNLVKQANKCLKNHESANVWMLWYFPVFNVTIDKARVDLKDLKVLEKQLESYS